MKILKTLCTRCGTPLTCKWPDQMTFGGKPVSPQVYMQSALQSKQVWICCDKCLSEMPDVRVEDLHVSKL